MIRVLIVEDSRLAAHALRAAVDSAPDMRVLGCAGDAYEAAKMIGQEVPDVLLLDLELPKMNGLTFLRKVMAQHPIPTVVCSATAPKGSDNAERALRLGASAVFDKSAWFEGAQKTGTHTNRELHEALRRAARTEFPHFCPPTVRSLIPVAHGTKTRAAQASTLRHAVERSAPRASLNPIVRPSLRPSVAPAARMSARPVGLIPAIIAIGASTGGTEALTRIARRLPAGLPGIVVVQHLPAHFTQSFADALAQVCAFTVRHARDDDPITPSTLTIAPGGRQCRVVQRAGQLRIALGEAQPVNRHCPSVDALFASVAEVAGARSVGVMLTGMGDDGARSMLQMRQAGARTLAQDRQSCVVFGMPKAAIDLGAVEEVLSLEDLPSALQRLCVVNQNKRRVS